VSRIADEYESFSRILQVAPMCIPSNTQLVLFSVTVFTSCPSVRQSVVSRIAHEHESFRRILQVAPTCTPSNTRLVVFSATVVTSTSVRPSVRRSVGRVVIAAVTPAPARVARRALVLIRRRHQEPFATELQTAPTGAAHTRQNWGSHEIPDADAL